MIHSWRVLCLPWLHPNRAVAVGEVDGPRTGLAALAGSTPPCPTTPPSRHTYTSVTVTR